MLPNTDIRFQVTFATVQLQASELTEADLKAPAAEFARLTHANDRAREGKLYLHKAYAMVGTQDGASTQGAYQGSIFDIDKGNGKQELRELCAVVTEDVVKRMYEGRIVTGE